MNRDRVRKQYSRVLAVSNRFVFLYVLSSGRGLFFFFLDFLADLFLLSDQEEEE